MLMLGGFGRGDLLAIWRDFHGPLVALLVSLVCVLAARTLRSALLATLSGGAGVLAGWWSMSAAPFVLSPRPVAERLPLLEVATMVIVLAAGYLAPRRGIWPPIVIIALASCWWLAGGPRTEVDVLTVWPVMLGIACAFMVTVRLVVGSTIADPLRPILAATTLAGSFHVVGAPWLWTLLALVPAGAAIPIIAIPKIPGILLLPLATAVAGVGSGAVLTGGRLPHGVIKATDLAVFAPLLAVWLAPHLTARLRAAGWLVPFLGIILSGLIAIAVTWGSLRLVGH